MNQLTKCLIKNIRLIVFLVLGLTPVVWFIGKGNILINGSDTNFPLDPAIWISRRFFVWQSVGNGGSDFSSSTAGTFFHLLQFIPYKLGLPLQLVEIINLVFWFMLIILSSWFLAKLLLPKRSIPQIVFVCLYSFNVYLFNTWENVKVANLSLVAAVPLGIAILVALREKRIGRGVSAFLSVITGIILSGAGINPAYIICFYFILVIFLVAEVFIDFGEKQSVMERLKDFFVVTIVIAMVNMFWILPTLNFIFTNITAQASIGKLGFVNWVDSLSANTSLVNVIRLQGAWDWYSVDTSTGLPIYVPYAVNYFYNPVFVAFSFLIPSIAFLSFIVKNKRVNYLYLTFGLMFVIGVFLCAGTHDPTGTLFKFLASHVPFFSLFRSPWYIFAPLVTLSTASLVALFFYNSYQYVSKRRIVVSLLGVVFIVGNLFYTYPLVTGKIFRPLMHDNFYIHFPAYVYDARNWFAKNPARGRILSYPDNEIERFDWGYNAVDSILNLISNREVVFASLNNTDSPVSKVVTELYLALKRGEIAEATSLANKLSIGQIFYKGDEETLSPQLPSVVTTSKVASFGKWSLYNFPTKNDMMPKIYSATCCVKVSSNTKNNKNLALISDNQVLVDSNDSLLKSYDLGANAGIIINTENSQSNDLLASGSGLKDLKPRFGVKDLSKVEYSFNIDESGTYRPILKRYHVEDFGLSTTGMIQGSLDGKVQDLNIVKTDDSYIYFGGINVEGGSHKLVLNLRNNNLVDEKLPLVYGDSQTDFSNSQMILFNNSKKDAGLAFNLTSFDPMASYLVSVSYKQIYGSSASVLVDQGNKKTLFKSDLERLPNYPEWGMFNFYYLPIQASSDLVVKLIAPVTSDALGTKVQYRNLSVYKVFDNELFLEKDETKSLALPIVTYQKLSSVMYKGEMHKESGSVVVVFDENYSKDWQLNVTGVRAFHFTANGWANAWLIDGAAGDYKFNVDYKPQKYLVAGYIVATITIMGCLVYLVYEKRFSKV